MLKPVRPTFPGINGIGRRQAIKGSLAFAAASAAPAPSVTAKIEAMLGEQVRGGLTPGIAMAIAKDGQVILSAGAGVRDLQTGAPMLPSTPQRIGSITKQFTAACILLLQQEGRLSIDDPLGTYVPEIVFGGRVTLRQMLNMASGISDNDPAIYGDTLTQPITRAAMLANLNRLKLIYPPGTHMAYTNTNYNLLGLIVERVSGRRYPDFLRARIFAPLDMNSSATMDAPPAGAALGYFHERPGQTFVQRPEMNNDFAFATGNIVSTPLDLLAWDTGLLSGKVLNAASLRTMFTVPDGGRIKTIRETDPKLDVIKGINDGGPTIYAMGWMVPNAHTRWHGGHTFLFSSANLLFSDGYAIAVIGNVRDGGTFSPENLAVTVHNLLNPGLVLPPVVVVTRQAKPETELSEPL